MGTHRMWRAALLAVALSAVFAAAADAHTVNATATCNTVTFHWTAFAASGNGNGGRNAPVWQVVYTPSAGGASTTLNGQVSFTGSSYSQTVTVPSGNGTVVASSSWTSAQTRDGHHAAWTKNLTIGNCPPPPPPAPPAPPTPPAVVSLAHPAISSAASADVPLGASVHDTALLSGGSSPTGTITFTLYSASDTACATPLGSTSVPANGAGSYDSPPITPATAGTYQWVATYSGDANNASATGACNDPAERVVVAVAAVKASCVASPVVLKGVSARVHRQLTVHVTAAGVKSVTFYLDGRKLATVTKAKNHRYSLTISAKGLRYGVHRLGARVTTSNASCTRAAAAGTFVKVKPPTIVPKFTG